MARQKRIYFEKAVYHISIRGNNRQMVLKEDEDKEDFLKTLQKYKTRFNFKLFGLVLMDNHAHLVIEVDKQGNISKIMQAVNLSYSKKFRDKYNYTGYVWQGRFKSSIIDDDEYILKCINYIHNNPVRAGMVKNIEDYLWSSYHKYYQRDDSLERLVAVDIFSL